MRIIDKLFRENAYGVAIRTRNSNESFHTKYPNAFKWFADPFPVHYEGNDYLFVEIMDYHNVYGQIAVAKIKNNKIYKFKTIISEPFHMSFPNVFQFHGCLYMIPETCQAKQVRLYKCIEFPYRWELDRILLEDIKLVDHALYISDNHIIMISYDISNMENKRAVIYSIDLENMNIKQINPEGYISQERAAGTVFLVDNELYRAVQDCTNCYGDYIKIYKIDRIDENRIEEQFIKEIHADEVLFSENRGIEHIHTLNVSETYEVIDFRYRKIYINKLFIRLWRNYIRKGRKLST